MTGNSSLISHRQRPAPPRPAGQRPAGHPVGHSPTGRLPTGRPPVGRPGRPLAAALGYLLVLAVTAMAFIGTSAGQWLDGRLVPRVYWNGTDPGRSRLIGSALTLLYSVEDPLVLGALILSVVLLGVLRRRARAGFAGIAALLCSAGGSLVLKTAVPRPDLSVAGSTAHNSFPSGHVAAATGLLLALLLALPDPARWWLAAPGALVVSAIGTAAMIAGWHRFSDVIGGVTLASLSCCLAAAVLAHRRAAGRRSPGAAGPGTASPGTASPGIAGPGTAGPGTEGSGTASPGTANPGTASPGTASPGTAGPGTAGPGTEGSGTASPGTASPGWLWRAVLVAAAGTASAAAVAATLPVAPGLALAAAVAGGFTAVSVAATTAVLSVTHL